ncbi:MAG: carbohydrate-binding family 9-like protein [Bacteroidales bacterium]
MKQILTMALSCILLTSCRNDKAPGDDGGTPGAGRIPVPAIAFDPEHYICYRAGTVIIDGVIEDSEWSKAQWSRLFTDIEGDLKPAPVHDTRIKMMWDDSFLYIAAELREPHIRAKLRQRDTVIYYDNDFEVFIDPGGEARIENGTYVKETDPATGRPLPEFNLLWSPQGLINIHYPEMWGFVQFSEGDGSGGPAEFIMDPDEMIKWDLRKLYYAQRAYAEENGKDLSA